MARFAYDDVLAPQVMGGGGGVRMRAGTIDLDEDRAAAAPTLPDECQHVAARADERVLAPCRLTEPETSGRAEGSGSVPVHICEDPDRPNRGGSCVGGPIPGTSSPPRGRERCLLCAFAPKQQTVLASAITRDLLTRCLASLVRRPPRGRKMSRCVCQPACLHHQEHHQEPHRQGCRPGCQAGFCLERRRGDPGPP